MVAQVRHPEWDLRLDRLLCSINDRLAGGPGETIEPVDPWPLLHDTIEAGRRNRLTRRPET